jgi:N6-L-threonylcarbamoyladenine synthase
MAKFEKAIKQYPVNDIAVAGGVSANSALRSSFVALGEKMKKKTHLLPLRYTTDNAAMIAISGFFKYRNGMIASQSVKPYSRQSSQS